MEGSGPGGEGQASGGAENVSGGTPSRQVSTALPTRRNRALTIRDMAGFGAKGMERDNP